MSDSTPRNLPMVIVTRVIDLRSEFEAQIRAVARLEHLLRQDAGDRKRERPDLSDAAWREVAEMITNNKNIRSVLTELVAQLVVR